LLIATWNVNSIRARLNILLKWLKKNNPDILLLQELKAQEDDIPRTELEDLNYNLTNNEMLIYESELDQNYLKELSDISNKKNRLIKNIHEMVKPDKSTVMLETIFNLDDLVY